MRLGMPRLSKFESPKPQRGEVRAHQGKRGESKVARTGGEDLEGRDGELMQKSRSSYGMVDVGRISKKRGLGASD